MNILLAEDNGNLGAILKKELEEDQHVVDLVSNGVEALLSFIDRPYSLVILDIRMPRLNGTDTLRVMRKINPRVPIITFSGNVASREMEESLECGAVACLTKPFMLSELQDEIKCIAC